MYGEIWINNTDSEDDCLDNNLQNILGVLLIKWIIHTSMLIFKVWH